jgi:radical SAM protein with 4Fe4S-binding SPASM domain
MHLSTAKQIIDQELSHTNEVEAFEFDLFGGEPFLEFDLLQEITEYICEKKGDIPCTVFATTNGTLVHGEVQEWLKKHAGCFVCGLSLDGTREMHNMNRSNSYDDIDLDFFREMYPNQDVKMTISQETLPDLAEGVMDIHRKGFLVSCNLAHGIDWSNSQNTEILNRELHKLIDFYLKNPNIEPCSMLEMGISNVGQYEENAVRYCGTGKYMRAYDVDGRAYPCQFFMPLSIGEEKAAAVKDISIPDEYLPDDEIDEKCRNCVVRSACPNCFGSNYASTGSIYKRDDNMCRLTKIILKARSYFRAKQWELGQLHETPDELQMLLRAIIKIQEELEVS